MGVVRSGEGTAAGVVGGVGAGVVDRHDVTRGGGYGSLLGVVAAYIHRVAFVWKHIQFVEVVK